MKVIPLCALVLLGCSRRDEPPTLTSATVDAGGSLSNLAQEWNRAVSQRDPTLLPQVYGDRVSFYGTPLRHDQVVAVENTAFAADTSFTQRISDVRVNGDRVTMRRKWIRFGKPYKSDVWIEGRLERGRWVVTAEGDDESDARARMTQIATVPKCEELALRIARTTKEGAALIEGPPDNVTVQIAATPPSFPAYAVAVTATAVVPTSLGPSPIVRPEPVTVAWYDVVPCTLYEPAPSRRPTAGACVTPGNAPGAVTDGFDQHVIDADPNLLVEMSKCPKR